MGHSVRRPGGDHRGHGQLRLHHRSVPRARPRPDAAQPHPRRRHVTRGAARRCRLGLRDLPAVPRHAGAQGHGAERSLLRGALVGADLGARRGGVGPRRDRGRGGGDEAPRHRGDGGRRNRVRHLHPGAAQRRGRHPDALAARRRARDARAHRRARRGGQGRVHAHQGHDLDDSVAREHCGQQRPAGEHRGDVHRPERPRAGVPRGLANRRSARAGPRAVGPGRLLPAGHGVPAPPSVSAGGVPRMAAGDPRGRFGRIPRRPARSRVPLRAQGGGRHRDGAQPVLLPLLRDPHGHGGHLRQARRVRRTPGRGHGARAGPGPLRLAARLRARRRSRRPPRLQAVQHRRGAGERPAASSARDARTLGRRRAPLVPVRRGLRTAPARPLVARARRHRAAEGGAVGDEPGRRRLPHQGSRAARAGSLRRSAAVRSGHGGPRREGPGPGSAGRRDPGAYPGAGSARGLGQRETGGRCVGSGRRCGDTGESAARLRRLSTARRNPAARARGRGGAFDMNRKEGYVDLNSSQNPCNRYP